MKEEFNRIYLKYKKQVIPVVLVSISLFIVFRIIIPQLAETATTRQEIGDKQFEIARLRQSLNALETIDSAQTEANLALVSKALPANKDISVIFSAISGAAAASGVELRDFSLKIGGLYGRAAEGSRVTGVPLVDVTVNLTTNDADSFLAFSDELQARLPLAEVKSLSTANVRGTFELGFYYRPIDLALLSRQTRVESLNVSQLNLLEQLKEWEK